MPKLLILANLKLAFDYPEGSVDPEALAQLKERQLLRILHQLSQMTPPVRGNLESLEFEGFTASLEGETMGYYYNKHGKKAGTL